MVCEDSMASPVPYSSAQGKGKRGHNDDQLQQSLEKRVHESGELLKVLAKPQPITAGVAFANYMHDSLLSLSKRRLRMARSCFTPILTELLDYDSDEEEPPTVHTVLAPASVRTCMAPATHQPPRQMCRQKAPSASSWGSQTTVHVDPNMQQPQCQSMMPPPTQHGLQPTSASASAAIGSAEQVPIQSPSAFDTSSQSLFNMSGFSGMLNLSGAPFAASTPCGELKTPPPPEKNYIQ